MSDINFEQLRENDLACPRCLAHDLRRNGIRDDDSGALQTLVERMRYPALGGGCDLRFDRTAECLKCGLIWVESLKIVDAYPTIVRDKRLKSAKVLNLAVNHNPAADGPPPGDAA